MKFRLWTILWVFAVFAAAMSTFGGGGGVFLSLVMLGGWAIGSNSKNISIGCVLVAVVVAGVFIALMLPAIQSAYNVSLGSGCMNNMKYLALAVLNSHDSRGSFPPAYSSDEEGQPLMSWRAEVLPFLEEAYLFDRLKHNEPWDSPTNKKLTNTEIYCYPCPSDPNNVQAGLTSYFAVVDDRTIWPEGGGRTIRDITDGTANTILLIEAGGKTSPWAKPEDLTFDEAVDLLAGTSPYCRDSGHPRNNGFFYKPSKVLNVAFADGHAQGIHLPISRELASALLTCSGGEDIDESELREVSEPELDYTVVFSVAIFLLVALLPSLRWMPVRSVAAVGKGILPERKKSEPPSE